MYRVYPILTKVIVKYILPVVVFVQSEKLFSKAKLTLNKQRNRLTSKHLNQLLFLRALNDTLWLA